MTKDSQVWTLVVTVFLALAGGIFFLGTLHNRVSTLEGRAPFTAAREEAISIVEERGRRIAQTLSDLPVGTLLPFVGRPEDLPVGWHLCDGKTLLGEKYIHSPYYGKAIPKLGDLFLLGTLDAKQVLRIVENDTLIYPHAHEIPHSHTGSTTQETLVKSKGGSMFGLPTSHMHNINTTSQDPTVSAGPSQTDESVTVTPRHVRVFYIIKVL